jgi:hypothetical protein
MRVCMALLIVSSVCTATDAQTQVGQLALLRDAVTVGQMVVVTEDSGREATGVVREVTDVSLTLDHHVFDMTTVRAVRRTDPLGDGTWAGAGVGLGATVALAAALRRLRVQRTARALPGRGAQQRLAGCPRRGVHRPADRPRHRQSGTLPTASRAKHLDDGRAALERRRRRCETVVVRSVGGEMTVLGPRVAGAATPAPTLKPRYASGQSGLRQTQPGPFGGRSTIVISFEMSKHSAVGNVVATGWFTRGVRRGGAYAAIGVALMSTCACGGSPAAPTPPPPPVVAGPSTLGRIGDLAVVADLLSFNQEKFVGFSTPGEGPIQRSTGVITRWEPPIPIYVDPSITGTSVAEAMTYWTSVTGLAFAMVGADAEARITVRAASVAELPASNGTGLVYRTYANNRAQLGVVKVALSQADCSAARSVECSALYRHELGHVLGIFDHVPGTGLMSPQGPSLNASTRELALLQQLYRLPHGTHIEPDGTWSSRAQP